MAIRDAKLTFGCGKNVWEYKSSRGRNKPIRKTNNKKWQLFVVVFVLETVKILYFVGAPFKLVTPLSEMFLVVGIHESISNNYLSLHVLYLGIYAIYLIFNLLHNLNIHFD